MTLLAAMMVLALTAAQAKEAPADLVLLSAKIWTGDPAKPEAEALAVRGARVVAVGMNKEIEALKGPQTRVLDGKWRRVVPGFIDSHTHMSGGGLEILAVDLHRTKDEAEFTRTLAAYAKTQPPGQWLTDGAWDHEQWTPPHLPTKALLDPATGDRPTCLSRQDGHMVVCNSLALKLAGVTRDTPDPPGGVIVKDASGEPTGILKDGAMDLVFRVRPERTQAELLEGLRAAMKNAAKFGVTSVQDLPGDSGDVPAWKALHDRGEMTVRVNYRPSLSAWQKVAALRSSVGDDAWLRIGGVKGYMDGALGSGTALMFEGFTDEPANRGVYASEAIPLSALEERVTGADAAGLQVEVHAIGDRANAEILDVFERVAKKNGPRDRRFRIEHAQHLRAADIPRFARLGVIASMQPSHAISDLFFATARLGMERLAGAYAWNSLLKTGAIICGGSDAPVERGEPMIEFYAAVARKSVKGFSGEGWHPEQAVSREQALKMFTLWPAYAAFEEKDKGSIEVGKLADFTVLSADIMNIPEPEILKTRCIMTVIGGEIVYENR